MQILNIVWRELWGQGRRARLSRGAIVLGTAFLLVALCVLRALARTRFPESAGMLATLDSALTVMSALFFLELALGALGWEIVRIAARQRASDEEDGQ